MTKKILASILGTTFVLGALTGCGSSDSAATNTTENTKEESSEATEATEEAKTELETIKVAASATPHSEILEYAAPLLGGSSSRAYSN